MESSHKYSLENVTSNPSSPSKFKSILKSINFYNKTDSLSGKCSSESDVFFFNKNVAKLYNKKQQQIDEKNSDDDVDENCVVLNRRYDNNDKKQLSNDSVDGGGGGGVLGGGYDNDGVKKGWVRRGGGDEKLPSSESSSRVTGKFFEQSRRNSRSEENLNFDRFSIMQMEFMKMNAKMLNKKKTDDLKVSAIHSNFLVSLTLKL